MLLSPSHFIDPALFAREILDFSPCEDQKAALAFGVRRGILNCCRQWGKTTVLAIRAAHEAIFHPNAVILIVSQTEARAAELAERAAQFCEKAGFRVRRDRQRPLGWRLANGARILPLPTQQSKVRGFPATLVILDEAALIPDDVYYAITGTRAFTQGALWVMSTPAARQGFFYDLWMANEPGWVKVEAPATGCPRISAGFLEEER